MMTGLTILRVVACLGIVCSRSKPGLTFGPPVGRLAATGARGKGFWHRPLVSADKESRHIFALWFSRFERLQSADVIWGLWPTKAKGPEESPALLVAAAAGLLANWDPRIASRILGTDDPNPNAKARNFGPRRSRKVAKTQRLAPCAPNVGEADPRAPAHPRLLGASPPAADQARPRIWRAELVSARWPRSLRSPSSRTAGPQGLGETCEFAPTTSLP